MTGVDVGVEVDADYYIIKGTSPGSGGEAEDLPSPITVSVACPQHKPIPTHRPLHGHLYMTLSSSFMTLSTMPLSSPVAITSHTPEV